MLVVKVFKAIFRLSGEIKVFQKGFTARSVGIARCEVNSEKSNSLDIWLGRVAMVGFVGVVAVEVATGKGVLEVKYFHLISCENQTILEPFLYV